MVRPKNPNGISKDPDYKRKYVQRPEVIARAKERERSERYWKLHDNGLAEKLIGLLMNGVHSERKLKKLLGLKEARFALQELELQGKVWSLQGFSCRSWFISSKEIFRRCYNEPEEFRAIVDGQRMHEDPSTGGVLIPIHKDLDDIGGALSV